MHLNNTFNYSESWEILMTNADQLFHSLISESSYMYIFCPFLIKFGKYDYYFWSFYLATALILTLNGYITFNHIMGLMWVLHWFIGQRSNILLRLDFLILMVNFFLQIIFLRRITTLLICYGLYCMYNTSLNSLENPFADCRTWTNSSY